MPAQIRPNRLDVTDRFPMLGFTIRTPDAAPRRAEVALSTDPALLAPAGRSRRTPDNFFASRSIGELSIPRGEAVYVVPPEVLARFVGAERLYFGLATASNGAGRPEVDFLPTEASPYVSLHALTGRSLRRVRTLSPRARVAAPVLEWAGDAAQPGMTPAGTAPSGASPGTAPAAGGAPAAAPYDDGFGPLPKPSDPPAPDGDGAVPGTDPGLGSTPPAPPPAALGLAARARGLSTEIPGDPGIGGLSIGMDSLQIGDIILTTARADILSGGIRLGSRGEISHAMLYVNTGEVVEAVGEGVVLNTLEAAIGHASTAIAFRVPGLSDADRQGIQQHAAGYLGRPYSVLGALLSQPRIAVGRHVCDRLPEAARAVCNHWTGHLGVGETRRGAMFCSQLVLQVFEDIGKRLTDVPADWNSPEAIRALSMRHGLLHYVGHLKSAPNDASLLDFARSALGYAGLGQALNYNIVTPVYAPSNPAEAAALLAEFQARYASWQAGVSRADWMPHAAICHFETRDARGNGYYGTGFYVAPDLILTAAHVLDGKVGAEIFVGRAGGDSVARFSARPADWTLHPRYDRTRAHDIAVLRVPAGRHHAPIWFDLEEQNSSTGDRMIVCGYAAEGGLDPLRQHMDGDYTRELSADGHLISYNLQTTGGSSGAPVFYVANIEDEAAQQSRVEYRAIGVHVALQDQHYNRGCRLTQAKIDWINGRGLATALSARPRALDADPAIVRPTIGESLRHRAGRIGGEFGPRIAAALDAGAGDAPVQAVLDALDPPATAHPMGAAPPADAPEAEPPAPPPPPRARAMSGAEAAIMIGGFLLETIRDNRGDVSWELNQFRERKHPNDQPPATPAPFRDGAKIRLRDWPRTGNALIGIIHLDLDVDWQCNGTSLGNVRITPMGMGDAAGWGLHVVAQIMDDNVLYPPANCAALRITIRYDFSAVAGSNRIALTEIHLYGDGTWEQQGSWVQHSFT